MKLYLAAFALLTACANNNYAVIAGGPGSLTEMGSVLRTCRYDSMQAVAQDQPHGGLLVGAVLGGAVGAVIGAAVDGPGSPKPDVNQLIEQCMRQRGYDGTSEN